MDFANGSNALRVQKIRPTTLLFSTYFEENIGKQSWGIWSIGEDRRRSEKIGYFMRILFRSSEASSQWILWDHNASCTWGEVNSRLFGPSNGNIPTFPMEIEARPYHQPMSTLEHATAWLESPEQGLLPITWTRMLHIANPEYPRQNQHWCMDSHAFPCFPMYSTGEKHINPRFTQASSNPWEWLEFLWVTWSTWSMGTSITSITCSI